MSAPSRSVAETLFADCVIPGCSRSVAAVGEVCGDCQDNFGDFLAPSAAPPMTAAQIEERDRAVTEAYRGHRQIEAAAGDAERKQNQLCWMCEERHACTRTREGWECDTCRGVL